MELITIKDFTEQTKKLYVKKQYIGLLVKFDKEWMFLAHSPEPFISYDRLYEILNIMKHLKRPQCKKTNCKSNGGSMNCTGSRCGWIKQ